MSGRIEQLHYTWARRGTEGINRFQISAMSPGLAGPQGRRLLSPARRVCRYDRPSSRAETPVSFGWLNHGKVRIAFCRVGRPSVRGTAGSFAAHILIGDSASIPEWAVASSFGTSFWWTGEEDDGTELPALATADLVAAASLPVPRYDALPVQALAHGLLTLPEDRRLLVRADNGTFCNALRILGRVVPEALAGLSLSTYEGAPTYPFKVIGGRTAKPRQLICDLAAADDLSIPELRIAEELLAPGRSSQRLRAAAVATAAAAPEATRQAYWQRAAELAGIAIGTTSQLSSPPPGITDPGALAYLAGGQAGRAAIADWVRKGVPGIPEAMAAARRQLDPAEEADLEAALVGSFALAESIRNLAIAADCVAPQRRKGFLDALMALAQDDPSRCAVLTPRDAVTLLVHAAQRGDGGGDASHVAEACRAHVANCAGDRAIPNAFIRSMCVALLREDGDCRPVLEAVTVRPGALAGYDLADDERDRCLAALELLDTRAAGRALAPLIPNLLAADDLSRLSAILLRLPSATAATCLARGLPEGKEATEALSNLCEDLACASLSDGAQQLAHDARQAGRSALAVLSGSRRPGAMESAAVLRDVLAASDPRLQPMTSRILALPPSMLRDAVLIFGATEAVAKLSRPAEVSEIWDLIAASRFRASTRDALRWLLQTAERRGSPSGQAIVLGWVGRELLHDQPRLVTNTSHLRDAESDRLARRLAALVPEWLAVSISTYIDGGDRRGRAWWSALLRHRKKAGARSLSAR